MKLTIIIVNWNTRDLLADCLSSIAATAGALAPEIIVSDNGSTDGSREMCRDRFPHVIFLENGANLGFGAANNRGLMQASGEYCLLLNSDTILQPAALTNAVAFMGGHPDVGGLGAMLLTSAGEVQRSVEQASSITASLRHHLHLGTSAHKRADYYAHEHLDVDYVSGAFLLLRREAIAAAGMFDEQFFMYAEEADLCLRIRRAGWRIAYTPEARVIHLGGGSAASDAARNLQRVVSRLRFLKKHHSPLYFQAFRLLSMCRSVTDFIRGRINGNYLHCVLKAHRELSYGR
jgi:GT2 family glycosyltransferase